VRRAPSGASILRRAIAAARHVDHGGAERRQLTVVFCDLVGSTSLASDVDPEDLRVILTAFSRVGHRRHAQFDGHVADL
jgi:class 3 adenylate cyclase